MPTYPMVSSVNLHVSSQSVSWRKSCFVGTYTESLAHVQGRSKAIQIAELDTESGALELIRTSNPVPNTAYLRTSADGRFLYATSEIYEFEGRAEGCFTVFAIDREQRRLEQVQQLGSHGKGPAYLFAEGSGQQLLLVNYIEGNLGSFPVSKAGRIGPPLSMKQHHGSGPNTIRQEAAHPHAIITSPDNRMVYAVDLGIDRIVHYSFNADDGSLKPMPELDLVLPRKRPSPHHSPPARQAGILRQRTDQRALRLFDRSQWCTQAATDALHPAPRHRHRKPLLRAVYQSRWSRSLCRQSRA